MGGCVVSPPKQSRVRVSWSGFACMFLLLCVFDTFLYTPVASTMHPPATLTVGGAGVEMIHGDLARTADIDIFCRCYDTYTRVVMALASSQDESTAGTSQGKTCQVPWVEHEGRTASFTNCPGIARGTQFTRLYNKIDVLQNEEVEATNSAMVNHFDFSACQIAIYPRQEGPCIWISDLNAHISRSLHLVQSCDTSHAMVTWMATHGMSTDPYIWPLYTIISAMLTLTSLTFDHLPTTTSHSPFCRRVVGGCGGTKIAHATLVSVSGPNSNDREHASAVALLSGRTRARHVQFCTKCYRPLHKGR